MGWLIPMRGASAASVFLGHRFIQPALVSAISHEVGGWIAYDLTEADPLALLMALLPTLETPRLLLCPIELGDAEQMQLLFPHWEIVRYLDKIVPWPYPPDGAYLWLRDLALPAMERREEWSWTLRLKSAPATMIGFVHLRKRQNNNRGFWVGLPWQGQGFMTEACDAATDYWFDVLKFPVLRAPKAVANSASRRISEKAGMRVVATEERDYVSGRFLTEIWEITAEEWHDRRKNRP